MPAPHITFDPGLDAGFDLLYQLKFDMAREHFTGWQQMHPGEPLGPALEAAADLFEQLYRQNVLTSAFFLDDKRLLGGIDGRPDPALEARFQNAANEAESLARARLKDRANDADALFALTLTGGMRADNAAIIEKKQLDSLRYLRDGQRNARELLEVAPATVDAYLALGAANYIVGCLPAYKRAFLWLGGVHGDKTLGMQQLSRAASDGHYLRPYAKLLLALAALREHNSDLARTEFSDLSRQFPENPLFASELARIAPSWKPGLISGAP